MSTNSDIFIEQAEYIDPKSFRAWGADHPDEINILKKLTQGGAKLISGPRGCGKTTLILKAYNKLIPNGTALPVYVNFKRSLSIEPSYISSNHGTFYFNQWIFLKIYAGLYKTLDELKTSLSLSINKIDTSKYISALELSNLSIVSSLNLSIDLLEQDILRVVEKTGRTRCVLLLDDAAHAFSSEQQKDFFDFFRQIKTREISPKAAIYPGVTTYSSSFHVGHDAEEIDVWVKPDSPGYLEFMYKVITNRFPDPVLKSLLKDEELIKFICYASFGIPRTFLNILQALTNSSENEKATIPTINRKAALAEIKNNYNNILKLFRSLKDKLPTYKNFIENGENLYITSIDTIKNYNKNKPIKKQSVSIALNSSEINPELTRLFGLFQYAGLCIAKKGSISRGIKGRFESYTIHYSALLNSNALLSRKAINISDYVTAFSYRDAHEFTRISLSALLNGKAIGDIFELSLPPCSSCNTPRINKDARFCSFCGAQLTSSSTYKHLISQDISRLPLTSSRIEKIKAQSSIRQIKDILLDKEHRELRKVDQIGPYWAEKIVRLAEEFVE